MNRKQLSNMKYAVLRLSPLPQIFDTVTGKWKPLDVLWRVTDYLGNGSNKQMEVLTMSGALGLRLLLPFDSIREWQFEDHHHPSFKQGRLLLKSFWFIFPEGQPARNFPIITNA